MISRKLTADQQQLVVDNMQLVPYAIERMFGHEMAADEDMQSIGNIALCNAAAGYNPDKGRFTTYAVKSIANEISKYIKYQNRMCRDKSIPIYSLNSPVFFWDTGEACELIDIVCDQKCDTENEAINKILCDTVRPYIPTFNLMDKESLSTREAGKHLKMSRQGILNQMNRELKVARRVLTTGRKPLPA